jgi:hypothetical protein
VAKENLRDVPSQETSEHPQTLTTPNSVQGIPQVPTTSAALCIVQNTRALNLR